MMKHSKAMDKKTNIVLAVIKIVCDRFPETIAETQSFINKTCSEECCKENISVDEVFFSINNNC